MKKPKESFKNVAQVILKIVILSVYPYLAPFQNNA